MDTLAELPTSLETDQAFASVIAGRLNKFVDQGILTPQDLKNAPAHAYDDFLIRAMIQEAGGEQLSSDYISKIQSIFASTKTELLENPPTPEVVTENVRTLLKGMRMMGFPCTGVLIYGSSIDKSRTLRKGSDVDLVFILNKNEHFEHAMSQNPELTPEENFIEDLNQWKEYARMSMKLHIFDEDRLPIQISKAYEYDQFNDVLDSMTTRNNGMPDLVHFPHWAWKRHSVQFVSLDPATENRYQHKLEGIFRNKNYIHNLQDNINFLKEIVS